MQATIEGLPPAPAAAPHTSSALLEAGGALRLAVMGTLAADALVRDTTRGDVVIEILLHQHIDHRPGATPLFAKWRCDDMGSYAATRDHALAKAAHLRTGALVTVLGLGLEPGHHHGAAVLRLVRTLGIVPTQPIGPAEKAPAHASTH